MIRTLRKRAPSVTVELRSVKKMISRISFSDVRPNRISGSNELITHRLPLSIIEFFIYLPTNIGQHARKPIDFELTERNKSVSH